MLRLCADLIAAAAAVASLGALFRKSDQRRQFYEKNRLERVATIEWNIGEEEDDDGPLLRLTAGAIVQQ